MYTIKDNHNNVLTKTEIDNLFFTLNKALRKKLRKQPQGFKADLYVVGGACIVAFLQGREGTTDIDAMWRIGDTMRDCINSVGDDFRLGHTWCNCDFKRTKSYTDAIIYNSWIYREYDRLIVRMVNLDLLLAMKIVAFRDRKNDVFDCNAIIRYLQSQNITVNVNIISSWVVKYYGSLDVLSQGAKKYMHLR